MTRLLALLLALLLSITAAEARVVAILFDDSGSMGGRMQLPSFGAQLLVSTLDGRQGEDRLIAARMSKVNSSAPIEFIDIKTTSLQQKAIDTIAARWPVANGATPYQQIELLLQAIKEVQQPGEEAFFVVLTDGLFNQGGSTTNPLPPPPGEEMRALFQKYKRELKGPLRADFMLIGADDGDVRTGVEAQGIRSALLSTFNGAPDDGRYDVYNSTDLIEATKSIIARIAATDRDGQSRFLTVSGRAISLDSPLSIKRIVAVAVGSEHAPPAKPEQPAFAVADRIELASRMRGADTKGGWAGEQLTGIATHFLLQPALPPGRYDVPFDREPEGVFLLFQTNAGLNLTLRNENGELIQPTGGIYRIRLGSKVTVGLGVVDAAGNQVVPVPASALGDRAIFKAALTQSAERRALEVAIDAQRDEAAAVLPTDRIGSGAVEASLRIEGFVSTFAKPIAIEILDVAGTVGIDATGVEECPTCSADEIRYTLSPDAGQRAIANVAVTVAAPVDGTLALSLANGPPWLALTDPSGGPLPARKPVKANAPIRIEAQVVATDSEAALKAPPGTLRFTVRAELSGGSEGSAEATKRIQLLPTAAALRATGHTQDPTGAKPLKLDLKALEDQSEALDFLLVDALASVDAGTVTVESDTRFVSFVTTKAERSRIALQPRIAAFCSCLVFLDRGERSVRITWTGPNELQSASVEEIVFVDPAWSEIGWACAKLALWILFFLYLLRSAWAEFQAWRFPQRSGISVYVGRKEEPLYRQLHRWDGKPFKGLLWPFLGNPHEVRVVEGLALRAASGGAHILLDRSDAAFRIETLNQTIEECRTEMPNVTIYKMNWNDSVERRDGGLRRLTLLRRPEDRAAA